MVITPGHGFHVTYPYTERTMLMTRSENITFWIMCLALLLTGLAIWAVAAGQLVGF